MLLCFHPTLLSTHRVISEHPTNITKLKGGYGKLVGNEYRPFLIKAAKHIEQQPWISSAECLTICHPLILCRVSCLSCTHEKRFTPLLYALSRKRQTMRLKVGNKLATPTAIASLSVRRVVKRWRSYSRVFWYFIQKRHNSVTCRSRSRRLPEVIEWQQLERVHICWSAQS